MATDVGRLFEINFEILFHRSSLPPLFYSMLRICPRIPGTRALRTRAIRPYRPEADCAAVRPSLCWLDGDRPAARALARAHSAPTAARPDLTMMDREREGLALLFFPQN